MTKRKIKKLHTIAIWVPYGGKDTPYFWRLYAFCPDHNRVNIHSGGAGAKPEGGWRAPHCACKNEYALDIQSAYKDNKLAWYKSTRGKLARPY